MIITAIASGVLTIYALAAARARRLLTSPKALRVIDRCSGVVMAGAAVTIAAR